MATFPSPDRKEKFRKINYTNNSCLPVDSFCFVDVVHFCMCNAMLSVGVVYFPFVALETSKAGQSLQKNPFSSLKLRSYCMINLKLKG